MPSASEKELRAPVPRAHLLCLLLIFLGQAAANYIWLQSDRQPPLWDMALHQSIGLRYGDIYVGNDNPGTGGWWAVSGAYPPLYHHLLAAAFLLGRDSDAATLANVPATLLLIFGTYLLGRRWFSAPTGLLAALLLVCFPYMAWISRETVIDYTMAALVLWTLIALEASEGFSRKGASLWTGVLLAGCALTKWIAPFFLALPVLMARCRKMPEVDRQADNAAGSAGAESFAPVLHPRTVNLVDAILAAGGISLLWYFPKLPEIMDFLRRNTAVGAAEGEPPVFSLQSLVYYLRLAEGQQLHLLFSAMALAGFLYAWFHHRESFFKILGWIASGYVVLTLLRTKDPRFSLPLLPALAVLAVCWIEGIRPSLPRRLSYAFFAAAAIGSFLLASFGCRYLPREILLAEGYQGSFRWDWKLYSQDYFGLLGAPSEVPWPQQEILERVGTSLPGNRRGKLALVPDFPRFNHENLRLAALLAKRPIEVLRLGSLHGGGEEALQQSDFILVSESGQGMEWSTRGSREVTQYILDRPERFTVDSFYTLPDGIHLRLYRRKEPAR